jgi:AbrB family looped-hinge helix DNA binding protein
LTPPIFDYFFFLNGIAEPSMTTTTITTKGQVTLPKHVRDAVGLKPGGEVEVRATAAGGVYIEKPGSAAAYKEKARAPSRSAVSSAV